MLLQYCYYPDCCSYSMCSVTCVNASVCLLYLQYVPVVQGLLVADPDHLLYKHLSSFE